MPVVCYYEAQNYTDLLAFMNALSGKRCHQVVHLRMGMRAHAKRHIDYVNRYDFSH